MLRPLVRSLAVLALAGAAVAACGTSAANTPAPASVTTPPSPALNSAASSAPLESVEPPTPAPSTDGVGPEYVSGSSSLVITKSGTQTVVGDVTQLRGQEMTSSGTFNDPRVNGTEHITLNADIQGDVAAEWGTTRLENAGGAWEGTWTGASWNAGNATSVSGWLVGSGAYAGYTYYFNVHGPSMPFKVDGIIFPGSAPTP